MNNEIFLPSYFKHGFTEDDTFEVLDDEKHILVRSTDGSYLLCGRNNAGQIIEIGFRRLPDGKKLFFHAMVAKNKYRRQYKG